MTRRCQHGARHGAALGRRGRGRDGVRNRRRRAGRRIFARRIPDAARGARDEPARRVPVEPRFDRRGCSCSALSAARSRSPRSPGRPALPAARRTPRRTRAPHGRPAARGDEDRLRRRADGALRRRRAAGLPAGAHGPERTVAALAWRHRRLRLPPGRRIPARDRRIPDAESARRRLVGSLGARARRPAAAAPSKTARSAARNEHTSDA